jgi:hypothetical protein
MSRVIHIDSLGKERTRLTRAVVLALRELAQQAAPGAEARDLAAFIALALERIAAGIDPSVSAWEKRGYWVKADRFRMEWAWTGEAAARVRAAALAEDLGSLALQAAQIATRLGKVNLPKNHRMGKPWQGAFARLQAGTALPPA